MGASGVGETNRFRLGRVTELDRHLAATEIEYARARGECGDEEAARRLAHASVATTHAALRVAVAGRADAAVLPMVEAAPRVAGAVWASVGAVNVVIWLLIGAISGQWDPTWLFWVLLAGAVLVGGIWGVRYWDRRIRAAVHGTP
ncbi:hypothetical protein CKY47_06005 [Saccharothrix yanglingensis]|uniref:DUF1707 domain-containing protein n=1 Tax=Saccharothrix yanglingensis TaxID=659496 RepID=A0ABU0WUK8_9PSEU|nr:hypothetical protein [Saccharothrix yanglingensis]